MGHLIHGEKTDWIPRLLIVLNQNPNTRTFLPFDRFAQFEESKGKTMNELLSEFSLLRAENLNVLSEFGVTKEMLELKALHPALGEVTMRNLMATWAVHDLSHIAQITRVISKQWKNEVGPWSEYLGILGR